MHTYIVSYLYLQELNPIEATPIRLSYNFNLPYIAVKYNNLQNSKATAKKMYNSKARSFQVFLRSLCFSH